MDGPDDTGKMFTRPGRLTDYITGPYKNDQEARFANNGALPPDLSLIVLARKGTEDYIFHLLTNYTDPPAGVTVGEGQAYNAYFPGGAIGMPQVIYDGVSITEKPLHVVLPSFPNSHFIFFRFCDS